MSANRQLSPHWSKHLLGCKRKGKEAYERGEGSDSCPYKYASDYSTGGKNITRQRRQHWLHGWENAKVDDANGRHFDNVIKKGR